MRERTELMVSVGEMIRQFRLDNNMSRSKFAVELGIDEHTLARWENGKSSPTVVDFIMMHEHFGGNAFRRIVELITPEIKDTAKENAAPDASRAAMLNYINNVANDIIIKQLEYITFGGHGSSTIAQTQLFCLFDHLSLEYRLILAKMALDVWEIASTRDDIINTDSVMPDIELLRNAIIKSHFAVMAGRNSYTSL